MKFLFIFNYFFLISYSVNNKQTNFLTNIKDSFGYYISNFNQKLYHYWHFIRSNCNQLLENQINSKDLLNEVELAKLYFSRNDSEHEKAKIKYKNFIKTLKDLYDFSKNNNGNELEIKYFLENYLHKYNINILILKSYIKNNQYLQDILLYDDNKYDLIKFLIQNEIKEIIDKIMKLKK